MKKEALALFIIVFCLAGCSSLFSDEKQADKKKELPRELTTHEKQIVSSGNAFSFNIFRKVVADETDKNIFISPLSISMALGMTLNGAAGSTRAGMKETLDMSEMELQEINQSYQTLISLLLGADPKVKMRIGNSLWGRKGFDISQSFKDTLKTYFGARVDSLDFSNPSSVDTINGWVEEQTNGRIEQIIEEIPPNMVLYLINAIYFKADWLYQFDSEDTQPEDFHLEDGSTVQVDMMNKKIPVATYTSEKVAMADLAYSDSLFTMTILMSGDSETSIEDFVQESLTASNVTSWIGQLKSRHIMTGVPKFESDYKKKLNDILIAMGMDEAFDGRADFSKINPHAALRISEVMHKANIIVNEEGSEAAAVTSVGIVETASSSFIVNRPFVYLIRERTSGTILFMGMMKDPSQ
ncbi:serpin family protein [Fodinibius salsisoli]|uniref:Serpin family protein n=1 Tax=Fodinibius salsisoli TaxID=2820877 RepID=A0ABT3PQB0_9BACT|nr:serpin family protein [Fodinibius salsisoli]MCW9708035.1 serpin family protein [Fodinibius salsisoli]